MLCSSSSISNPIRVFESNVGGRTGDALAESGGANDDGDDVRGRAQHGQLGICEHVLKLSSVRLLQLTLCKS